LAGYEIGFYDVDFGYFVGQCFVGGVCWVLGLVLDEVERVDVGVEFFVYDEVGERGVFGGEVFVVVVGARRGDDLECVVGCGGRVIGFYVCEVFGGFYCAGLGLFVVVDFCVLYCYFIVDDG